MSKYIIEIEEKPLCVFDKDTQTYFPRLWRVKGFNSLVFDEEGLSRLDELNSDYINKHYGNLQDDAYQRGLEDGKAVNDKGCGGCKWEGRRSHEICETCCNAYYNQWTAKDDKFEFGDEIIDSNGIKGCVVSKDNEEYDTMYALFDCCRVPQYVIQSNYRKTGKRYDIEKILEEMKGDNDK